MKWKTPLAKLYSYTQCHCYFILTHSLSAEVKLPPFSLLSMPMWVSATTLNFFHPSKPFTPFNFPPSTTELFFLIVRFPHSRLSLCSLLFFFFFVSFPLKKNYVERLIGCSLIGLCFLVSIKSWVWIVELGKKGKRCEWDLWNSVILLMLFLASRFLASVTLCWMSLILLACFLIVERQCRSIIFVDR